MYILFWTIYNEIFYLKKPSFIDFSNKYAYLVIHRNHSFLQ